MSYLIKGCYVVLCVTLGVWLFFPLVFMVLIAWGWSSGASFFEEVIRNSWMFSWNLVVAVVICYILLWWISHLFLRKGRRKLKDWLFLPIRSDIGDDVVRTGQRVSGMLLVYVCVFYYSPLKFI
jgi:hypothetical protein